MINKNVKPVDYGAMAMTIIEIENAGDCSLISDLGLEHILFTRFIRNAMPFQQKIFLSKQT